MDFLSKLFGEGTDLNALQMSSRALVVFGLTLLAVRIAGRRSFGQRTPFDQVVAILLGALMSRAVVGASPFMPTVAATLTIVCVHRALAWLSASYSRVDELINGKERILAKSGIADRQQMRKGLISDRDLAESLRSKGNPPLAACEELVLERSGKISVIEKRP